MHLSRTSLSDEIPIALAERMTTAEVPHAARMVPQTSARDAARDGPGRNTCECIHTGERLRLELGFL